MSSGTTIGGLGGTSFTTGDLLNETFSVFFADFVTFFAVTGLLLSPTILLNVFVVVASSRATTQEGQLMIALVAIVPMFLALVLQLVATGAISYGVFQQVRGRPADFAECVSVGFSHLLPLIGVSIVAAIVIGVGTIFCVIPGVFFTITLFVAIPVTVVERPGVLDALHRSVDLTYGYRWSIFGLWFVLTVVGFVLGWIGGFLGLAGELGGLLAVEIVGVLVQGAFTILVAALHATGASLVYYRLRAVKESIDANELASVFD